MSAVTLRAFSVLVAGCAAFGCTRPAQAVRAPATVRVSSSASSAPIAEALAAVPGVAVESVRVSGSPAVIESLRRQEIEIGVATADVAYLAFAGQLDEEAAPFEQLRGIAVMALNTLHLIVAENSPARTVADLRGTTLALSPTSGTALVARLLLEASGVDMADVRQRPMAYADAATALARHDVDAAFMTIVPPGEPGVAATKAGARILEIEGPGVERLRLLHPFLVNTIIPRGTYPGQHRPIRTIGVDLLLVCRADLDEALVVTIMDAYFGALSRSTPAIDFDRAPAMSIPLHPAAARYYRQRELSR